MKQSQCLGWWRHAPQQRSRRSVAPDWVNAGNAPTPLAEEVLPGCGWFNSSHELQSGLLVTEHASPDRVANEVLLGWWLDWQSSPPQPSGQPLQRPC